MTTPIPPSQPGTPTAGPRALPRKVVLIFTDSQGANALGCYGAPLDTPHLDRLAAEGLRFERAYTTCPVCSPARGGLFTGIYPHTNGCWGNSMPLAANVRTLGQRLSRAGIRAGYIGKWHLDAFDYFGDGQCPEGWDPDHWYDMRCYLEELPDDERRRSRQWSPDPEHPTLAENTFAHRCAGRAIRFLEQHADQDFFLTVAFDEPHGPHKCPPEYRRMYENIRHPAKANMYDPLTDKPDHHRAWAAALNMEEVPPEGFDCVDYFACNRFVDDQVGRLLEAVDRLAPDCLVLFSSDHGYLLHAHQLYGKGPCMYDEATRIPLLARWPGHIPPGTVRQAPVSHIDLLPTLLEIFDLPVSATLQGESLLPRLTEGADHPRTVFIEFNRFSAEGTGTGGLIPIRCAFNGHHKLVLNLFSSDELYDVVSDPGEMNNRIDDPVLADIRNTLHEEILRWMARTRDPFACWLWQARPWAAPRSETWWKGDGFPSGPLYDEQVMPTPVNYSTGLPEIPDPLSRRNI